MYSPLKKEKSLARHSVRLFLVQQHQNKYLQQPSSWWAHRRETSLHFKLERLLQQAGKLSPLAVAVSGQRCAQGHPWGLSPRLPSGMKSTEHLQWVPARGKIIPLGGQRCFKQSREEVAAGCGEGVQNSPLLKTCWKVYRALANPENSWRSLLCQF